MKKIMILLGALIVGCPFTARAEPVLLQLEEVSPSYLTEVNGIFFFSANDSMHGNSLWRSDGTRPGTRVVKSFDTGGAHEQPRGLLNAAGTLYFCAYEAASGWELWKSDGTEAGTTMVTEINPGSADGVSDVYCQLAYRAGTIFFAGNDPTNGWALWKSDGTAANTVMVHDLQPLNIWGLPQYPFFMGTTLYFSGNDAVHGDEWWKCEGPAYNSATMIKDIWPGIWGGISVDGSREPVVLNGSFYFQGNDGSSGYELWRSDGTSAGTVRVKDITSGAGNGYPSNFTLAGDTLFFTANDGSSGYELWKSNGTEGGTVLVKDINPTGGSSPDRLAAVGTTLYFAADDGTSGTEPWKSDGTMGGTVMVADINPGPDSSWTSYFTAFQGDVYFGADDGVSGDELWKTDTTVGNATLVADIAPGGDSSWPNNFLVMNGALYFRATYDNSVPEGEGDALFRYGDWSSDFYWPLYLPIIIHNAQGKKK